MKLHQNLPHNASSARWENAPLLPPTTARPSVSCHGGGGRRIFVLIVGLFCFCLPSNGAVVSTSAVGEVQQSRQVTGRGGKHTSSHPPSPVLGGGRGDVGGGRCDPFLLLGPFIPFVCTSSKVFPPLVLSPGTNNREVHGINCHWC